jgi:hypothetical protein
MKVTGFTFIKNALIYDYPVVEAITSVLPVCDEFVVAVGQSQDDTLDLISNIDRTKIKIIRTDWNEQMREGGRVLALETDKAFAAIPKDTDWAFYIQGDEVIHEKYLKVIQESMVKYKDDIKVDGLLFKYLHFYGSYDYVIGSSDWYDHEIRIVRNDRSIYSYRDAQGFRKGNNQKLHVKPVDAWVYHYGWVKDPKSMQKKQQNFNRYWHDDLWISRNVGKSEDFDYFEHIDYLVPFHGTHPEVMKNRIEAKNWKWDYRPGPSKKRVKDIIKSILKKYFGFDPSYRNYRIL